MEAWIVAAVVATVAIYCWHRWRQLARAEFIRSYTFPHGLFDKLRAKRPQLDTKQLQLVSHALRQFFLAYLRGGRRYVSMPSQVADDLWHEFILYTRNYAQFCRRAFGRFLHHTPAAALGKGVRDNDGLRRCWWQACREENIHPQRPTRLPLLFALDRKLKIKTGFLYLIDCRNPVESAKLADTGLPIHCATDLRPLRKDKDGGCSSCGGGSSCSGDSGCSGGCGGGD
jgi:hypothetical protein